jgi:hypothetical protein
MPRIGVSPGPPDARTLAAKEHAIMTEVVDWATRLERDGYITYNQSSDRCATKRWHAALARAALRLYQDGEDLVDLRVPIVAALAERYETDSEDDIADAVGMMLVVTLKELVAISRSHG